MHASLNNAYRLIWNTARACWMAVGEHSKTCGKGGGRVMAALLLTAGITSAGGALADDVNWVGTTGNWTTGTNWSGGTAPTSADNAIISSGGTVQVTAPVPSISFLNLGDTGSGTLAIGNSGYLNSFGGGIIGNGSVTVDGGSWVNSNALEVGYSGTGSLSITNGGSVSNTVGRIANQSGSHGSVTVDGANSNWTNGDDLSVGVSGTGTLAISHGGAVTNGIGFIGNGAGSSGGVTVSGIGSNWTNTSALYVGYYGAGTLEISDGGHVSAGATSLVGAQLDSVGSVTVSGTNSSLDFTNNLHVGDRGTGTLNISNGGAVSNGAFNGEGGVIGSGAGAIGTVTVDGANSTWTSVGSLTVGKSGTGTLNILNGGSVTNNAAGYIGQNTGGTGTVTVSGTNSTWTNSSGLRVGDLGAGTLTLSNGGVVTAYSSMSIGNAASGHGDVTVTGTNSKLNVSASAMNIGVDGTGTLNITNGGWVNSSIYGVIGANTGSNGTVTVDGSGSRWTTGSAIYIGNHGQGTLNIRNGGSVSNDFGYIASSGSTSIVTVDGSGSIWSNGSDVVVGRGGTATLTVSNGGTVSTDSGSGTVIIAQGGGSGTLNIGAAQGSAAAASGTLNAATVAFDSGTGQLVFNHTSTAYDFAPAITGSGSVSLYGGTTHFTGNLGGYTGTMTVDGGTLNIVDAQTMMLGGQYTQSADGTLKIGASSASSYGKLDVTGQATFAAGTGINVNVASTNTLANGNTLSNVIAAGNLSASTFNVTDNSTLFNFTASVTAGANGHVDLNTVAATSVLSSVQHTGFTPGEGAARILDTFVQGGTTSTDMDHVVTALGQLGSEAKVSDAVAQTLPLMNAGLTNVAVNALHETNRVIQARQDDNRGLSSGDTFLGDKKVWFKPVGSWGRQDNRNGVAGYNANTFGFIAGMDGEFNEANRIGFAISYMDSNVDGKSTSSSNSADIGAYQAIAYGSHSLANLSDTEINWQADVGINKNSGQRVIAFGGLNRVAKSDYDSATAHAGAGIARHYSLNEKTAIVPAIRADYTYIRDESYTENGADALNLNVKSRSVDELIVMAEGRLSHKLNDRTTLVANAGLGYDVLDGKNSITASYVGGGSAFSTQGMDLSPWLGRAGLGLTFAASETTEITARYDLESRSDFVNQTASAKVRWAF